MRPRPAPQNAAVRYAPDRSARARLPDLQGPVRALAFAAALLAAQLAMAAPGAGGIYQPTRLKDFCLCRCRSPVAFLLHVAAYRSMLRDIRAASTTAGIYRIGCCSGLMVVLTAVGVMMNTERVGGPQ